MSNETRLNFGIFSGITLQKELGIYVTRPQSRDLSAVTILRHEHQVRAYFGELKASILIRKNYRPMV